jgi:hypothetical protein
VPTDFYKLLIPGVLAFTAGRAAAQPVPVPIPLPPPTTGDPAPPTGDPVPPPTGDPVPPTGDPVPVGEQAPTGEQTPPPVEVTPIETTPPEEETAPPEVLPFHARLPELLLAPAGSMLAGGVLYSRTGVDTSGGLSWDMRVGLGDLGEFGVATTDLIRAKQNGGETSDRLAPYYMATFRLGIDEDNQFKHQPAVAIGFRKSFEYEKDGHRSRIAELYLAATKHFGRRAAIHANIALWDALVENSGEAPVLLHDQGLKRQVRPGGGIELRAKPDADILVDVAWVPELCYTCTAPNRVKLRAILSWGVRYELADWAQFQAGVRVPDIGDANLLDAQIFGQLTLLNSTLRRVVHRDR